METQAALPAALPNAAAFSVDEINGYLAQIFPQIGVGRDLVVESLGPMTATMRLRASEAHLRPGGTISGPSMFALADVALYVAILGQIGPVHLAVTTNLNINFLKKPGRADLIEDRLLRFAAEAAGLDAGIGGCRQDGIAVADAEANPLQHDRRIGDPAGPEFEKRGQTLRTRGGRAPTKAGQSRRRRLEVAHVVSFPLNCRAKNRLAPSSTMQNIAMPAQRQAPR